MLNETDYRRPSFLPGTSIRLADDQEWVVPLPSPASDCEARDRGTAIPFDAEHAALLRMILEAEDLAERRRGELAYMIYLLSRNYDLEPAQYQELLGFLPGSRALAAVQEAIHEIVVDHMSLIFGGADRPPIVRAPLSRDRALGSWIGPISHLFRFRADSGQRLGPRSLRRRADLGRP